MTEVITEPVAVPATPTTPLPPPQPAPAAAAAQVDHTPGGWPVLPLALSGANTTVGALSAAALVGGPIAAAVAGTGMLVLGVAAATRNRNPSPRREARRTAARTAGGQTARRANSHRPTRSTSAAGRIPGQSSRRGASTSRSGSPGTASGRGTAGSRKQPTSARHGSARAAGKAAGRAGQVRALRAARQAVGGSRAQRRAQTTAARRAVADARRNASTRSNKHGSGSTAGRGPVGRLLGGAAGKARAAQKTAIAKQRNKRDAKTADQVAAKRSTVRKASARKAARKELRRSAARFHRRRLLAALVAGPLGVLGFLTSPIGRKYNIPWLVNPGRRLYARLTRTAAGERTDRDEAIRERLSEKEAAADAAAGSDGTEGVADRVERPAPHTPTPGPTSDRSGGPLVSTSTSGFKFEDHATDMQAAAWLYQPDGCMEILTMVEGLPEALKMVAHVMQILAERSDIEFPLEKEVADGFNDIYEALRKAAESAEELPAIFRRVHEQDIARHEEPRNGTEAEKGWNV